MVLSATDIAKVAHEANRAYCEAIGDVSQVGWDEAPEWQKESAIDGVLFHLVNVDATPSVSHTNWMTQKVSDGWEYGPIKDQELKQHPCMVPYEQLPEEQKMKDALFIAIVHALGGL